MTVLDQIPFSLDAESLMARLHIAPGSAMEEELRELLHVATACARPKAMYKEAYVETGDDDEVRLDGVTFTSRPLRMNLDSVHRVFAYVATCGREVDDATPAPGDVLEAFWWDTIKADLLTAARQYLTNHLKARYHLRKMAYMGPGSADATVWPIQQQRQLFHLLGNVEAEIGVRLTDSFLMVPNKSVSGILFTTEKDFRSCQLCHREDCPDRRAPFDPELWESIVESR
ncbi:MAG: vitamin B12 dependent-methionine synthase activation domain-containing protein [Chloroflexota bacterium]|nr:vitamin B12 dependent-methionine synthase activation domain-containing protein [Chloroflexota bacterium]